MAATVKSEAQRGAREAVEALRAICADPEAKHGDKINAAKLLIEYARAAQLNSAAQPGGDALRVTLENVPPEYLA